MDHRESNHVLIQEEAVAWLVKRDSDEWTPSDDARLDAWLAQSTAHRVAFLRLEAGWEGAHRLKALATGRLRGAVPPMGDWGSSPFFESTQPAPVIRRRPAQRPFWVAACALLVLALSLGLYFPFNALSGRYSTPVGGIASVPLKDGSKITLNTHTQVRVDLRPHERRIDLYRGEAFFQVAKDPSRPFVVRAGDKRIVAVGTQFSVRRNGEDVRVVVTEGTVRFETDGAPVHLGPAGESVNVASAAGGVPLAAGSVARAHDQDLLVQKGSVARAEEMLSWRQGYLTFHDTPLSDALADFNRYNVHQLAASDPATASLQISGMFRPTNYAAFVRLLQEGYGLKAHVSQDSTVLSKE